jgi:hypothetical protein
MLVLWGKIQGLCREECGNLLFHVEQMGAFFAPKRALIDEHQGQSSSGSQKRVTLLPEGLPSISSGRAAKFEDFPTRNVPRGTTLSRQVSSWEEELPVTPG